MSLVVQDLTCTRAGRHLFAPVTLTVTPGTAVILRGANGAGKTTLLRALGGLMPFDGSATLEEAPVTDADGQIAYAGHLDAIKPSLTVAENLAFWSGLGTGTDIAATLARFDLAPLADRPAGRLSAGQRRRTGLARLALTPAKLWLLDEPTNSLDTDNTARFTAIIAEHLGTGGLAVIATHTPLDLAAPDLHLQPPAAETHTDPFLQGPMA